MYLDPRKCPHPNHFLAAARLNSPRHSPKHAPGDDQYGYEDAGERWMPVHTVESIVSRTTNNQRCLANWTFSYTQLLSVISLLSSEKPNLDSPANVDAAKEVRTDFAGLNHFFSVTFPLLTRLIVAYKKKVRRLVRRSAEEAFD